MFFLWADTSVTIKQTLVAKMCKTMKRCYLFMSTLNNKHVTYIHNQVACWHSYVACGLRFVDSEHANVAW